MRFQKTPSLLLVVSLTFPAIANAALLSGVLVAGGGIDDLSLSVQRPNGQQVIIYCNGLCGDWFDEDKETEGMSLKKALVGKRIDLEYKAEKNRFQIAGPGEDETLKFLKKAQLQR